MTVIYEMTRVATLHDRHSEILVSHGTRHDYGVGRCIEIDAVSSTPRSLKAVDVALGRVGLSRRFTGRSYRPSILAIEPGFDGIVFLHNCPAAVGQFRGRCPRAMICLWAHNELFRTFSNRETRRVVRTCDRVICVSRYIADDIRDRCGDDDGRICVVHNGVDVARFRPEPQFQNDALPTVLFVGRVIPEKGPDFLLRAAAKVHAMGRKFRVRIVGSSGFSAGDPLTPYERELRRLAEPMGNAVEFQPFVDREKVVREYQSASIFCAPATWNEPVSLTVSEAMACGLPTIASRRGGIPEIGENAVIYLDPPNVDALAVHLTTLLDDAAARQTWAGKARARAESISWEQQYCILSDVLGSAERES